MHLLVKIDTYLIKIEKMIKPFLLLIWEKICYHWNQRITKVSTLVGLCIFYLEIFHRKEFSEFLRFLFMEVFKDLILNIINNPNFINTIAVAVAAYLVGTKKF